MNVEITKHDTLPIAAIRSEDRGSQHCKQAQVCFAEQSTSLVVSSRLHMSLQRLEWAERQRNASHVFASFSLANIPLGSSSFAHNREFGIACIRAPYILVIPKEDYLVLWPLYWAEPNCKVKVPVLNMASCPLYVPQSWSQSRTSITARWIQFASVYINGLKTETHH